MTKMQDTIKVFGFQSDEFKQVIDNNLVNELMKRGFVVTYNGITFKASSTYDLIFNDSLETLYEKCKSSFENVMANSHRYASPWAL